jgi:hypothetical protein
MLSIWMQLLFAAVVFSVSIAIYFFFQYFKQVTSSKEEHYVNFALAATVISGVVFGLGVIAIIWGYVKGPRMGKTNFVWQAIFNSVWAALMLSLGWGLYLFFKDYEKQNPGGTKTKQFLGWSYSSAIMISVVAGIAFIAMLWRMWKGLSTRTTYIMEEDM